MSSSEKDSNQKRPPPAAAATRARPDTKKTKPSPGGGRHQKTLGSLLHYFVGMELSIELKTGRIYRGTLSTADDYMNMALDDAEQLEPRNSNAAQQLLITCHIRGSNIRYIHFPDHLDLVGFIRAGQDRERAAAQKYKRGTRNTRSVTTGGKAQQDTEQTTATIHK